MPFFSNAPHILDPHIVYTNLLTVSRQVSFLNPPRQAWRQHTASKEQKRWLVQEGNESIQCDIAKTVNNALFIEVIQVLSRNCAPTDKVGRSVATLTIDKHVTARKFVWGWPISWLVFVSISISSLKKAGWSAFFNKPVKIEARNWRWHLILLLLKVTTKFCKNETYLF